MLRLDRRSNLDIPGNGAARGCVYVVGAGPGHPGLITARGLACLRRADVVVYDRLIPPALLAEAPPDAERISAAKSPRRHRLGQREIEALLIARAREGRTVVRLKGGDPFIFGRGGEEALALQEANIPWEVVPGVSSVAAVPAAAGIPLTHRGVSDGFAVWTAQRGNGTPAKVLDAPTQVILMGLGSLRQTVAELLAHGRAPDTPAAVISWGTTARQRSVCAPLQDIALKVEEAGLEAPAVVVVGPVAALADALGAAAHQGTADGRPSRRGITRLALCSPDESPDGRPPGTEAFPFPLYRYVPGPTRPLARAAAALASYSDVVFTHRATVEALMEERLRQGKDLRELHGTRLWAASKEAAAALKAYGALPDGIGVPEGRRLAPFGTKRDGVILVCGRAGDEAFVESLQERGIGEQGMPGCIEFLAAAIAEPLPEMVRALRDMAGEGMIDGISVDGTAARILGDSLGAEGWAELKAQVHVEFSGAPAPPPPAPRGRGLAARVVEAAAGWMRRAGLRNLDGYASMNSVKPGR